MTDIRQQSQPEIQGNFSGPIKRRILVVEDDPDHVELLEYQFAELKIPTELTVFASGSEAVEYLKKQLPGSAGIPSGLPDLIILDLFLPGEDGIKILETIKKNSSWAAIPIVIVTSSTGQEHIQQSYRKGCTMFIKKPFSQKVWADLIGQLRVLGLWK